jgi:uncharacterized protein
VSATAGRRWRADVELRRPGSWVGTGHFAAHLGTCQSRGVYILRASRTIRGSDGVGSRRVRLPIDVIPGGVATGDSFFGRQREVASLWENLNRGRNLLLVSPRRVGKTSILRHLADAPKDGWVAVYVDVQIDADPVSAIEHILDELKSKGPVGTGIWNAFVERLQTIENIKIGMDGAELSLREAAGRRWDSTAAAFRDALVSCCNKGIRLLLIVDELPILVKALVEADKTEQAEQLLRLFRFARQHAPLLGNFRMIVCGSIGLKPVLRRHRMSADANDLKDFSLGPWSEETARAFMDAIGRVRPRLALRPELRDEILRWTGAAPLPYHLQSIFAQIEEMDKDPEQVSLADIATARDEVLQAADFSHYYERLDSGFEPDELEFALDALSHLTGTESSDLAALQALAPGSRKVRQVLRTLEDDGYLANRGTADNPIYLFSNPLLKAYWTNVRA